MEPPTPLSIILSLNHSAMHSMIKLNLMFQVRKHIERIHCPKDKMCEMCDKTFATEALLAKHTQIEHLLEELSKCSVCDKV